MIEIVGSALYQWDTDRTVNALDVDIDHIHLSNPGDAYAVIMEGSTVAIPNYLLQSGKPVVAYAVKGGVTVESKTFPVHKRERPENYVYDEDRRNFIYELIANAEWATRSAELAAYRANEAADRAGQFAGDVESIQLELNDLRTDYLGNEYDSAGNAVRGVTLDLNARLLNSEMQSTQNTWKISSLDEGFENRVEKTVVAGLQAGEIFDGVHGIAGTVTENSLYAAGLIENEENGEKIYHAERIDNPHNVTCEQIGAVTEDALMGQVIDINVVMESVSEMAHNNTVDIAIHTNTDENPNPHEITCEKIGAVTKEQHNKDIQDAKDAAQQAEDRAMDEIRMQVDSINDIFSTKAEVDAALAESKAVIVTVSGTTPSHTSQEIYALIQAGKVVYLQQWGNTYVICSACTESEAKFENSVVTTATGADGKTYNVQRFRLYFIKNDRYAAPQTIESPSIEYLDAAIAALNQ